ncbi:MAG: hypothetical protein K6T81_18875 [Alicyclobacillus macrosporangiidus]|uniref:hypothetical protein n=1 Tax=Alicyclobacillus macrosporangiidus TaxID=392015 RepID=UPI0026EC76F9|nr:hypothetical protein [Alicyclobacillus macrosporangiidus]MCL6600775.1 hypothetical protein [Alicyclobacillus macrosporangiidus]
MPPRPPLRISSLLSPLLTVAASAAILGTAVWVHNQWGASAGSISLPTGTRSTDPPDVPSDSGTSPSTNVPGAEKTNDASVQQAGGNNTGRPRPAGDAGAGVPPQSATTTPAQPSEVLDKGFSPVRGGRVDGEASHPPENRGDACVVRQYGIVPRTTLTGATLTAASGIALTLPQPLTGRLLAIPLSHGILWWTVEPTDVRQDGTRGPAKAPASLYYTPASAQPASPTTGAIHLTDLPVSGSAEGDRPGGGSWTRLAKTPTAGPTTGRGGPGGQEAHEEPSAPGAPGSPAATPNATGAPALPTNAEADPSNPSINPPAGPKDAATSAGQTDTPVQSNPTPGRDAAAPGPTTNQTASADGTQTAEQPAGPSAPSDRAETDSTPAAGQLAGAPGDTNSGGMPPAQSREAPVAGTHLLYPFGLYRVADGAILAVSALPVQGGPQEVWLYHWREGDAQLTPLVRLANGGGVYSWFAVGTHLVYWETRQLIPPAMTHFSGVQWVYSTADGQTRRIALGHWVEEAVADGDDLWFRPGGQVTWRRFTPDRSLLP